MKESNKIDNLFKTRIPQNEKLAPEEVWENIATQLSKPRKKKSLIIPLWFKIAGVAAVLLMFFTLIKESEDPVINSPTISNQPFEDNHIQQETFTEENSAESSQNSALYPSTRNETPETEVKPGNQLNKTPIQLLTNSSRKPAYREILKSTEITFKTGNVNLSGFLLSVNHLDINHLKSQVGNLKNLEEENVENSEGLVDTSIDELSLKNRISITPTIAAIYSGKLGKGNSLDGAFSNNSNPGNIEMAYGLSLAYQLSQRVKIRTGFNNIIVNSTTQNVDNTSAINSSAIQGNPVANIYIPEGQGALNQHLGFLELPLEMELALIENRFAIHLIAGVSTYILLENEVSLDSALINASLGPANNINDTSFSTNFGLGFTYQFSSRFFLNVDPIIKYHTNLYENRSELKPYFLGIYSGIRFKL